MSKGPDLALVKRARNPAEAQLLYAILTANDVPTYLDGTSLQDEWALSQQQINGVRVFVPRSRLEEAREILEAAREAGETLGGDDDSEDGDSEAEGTRDDGAADGGTASDER